MHLVLIGQSPDSSSDLCRENYEQEHEELERKTMIFVLTAIVMYMAKVEIYDARDKPPYIRQDKNSTHSKSFM